MKFGGTSVGSKEAITRTIGIVKGRLNERPVVVVSAMSKVTDMLYKIADAAAAGEDCTDLLSQLRDRHFNVIDELLFEDEIRRVQAHEAVNQLIAVMPLQPVVKAGIISTGELLSSTVIGYVMNSWGIRTAWVDVREMMVLVGDPLKAAPDQDELCRKAPKVVDAAMSTNEAIITQGFIGHLPDGSPAVLGRGGSDYSASLIGMALDAVRIEIWTDVDGVKTADPRKVDNTQSLSQITFEQAAEMAHFGAKVLHPLTMEPAIRKNIPIYVLNSMNPSGKGTVILHDSDIEDGVKSLSSKDNMTVLNLSSNKMINTSSYLNKVFDVLSEAKVAVDLVNTTEDTISMTIESTPALETVVGKLSRFMNVSVEEGVSQVSVIGKNIMDLRELLVAAYPPIKDSKVFMISQGASYVNVTFVVEKSNVTEVLREIHRRLFE